MELGSTLSLTEFAPQEFYADNNAVIVKGYFAGTAIGTGKPFASDWVQIWKLRGDKIYNSQAFIDTDKIITAIK